MPITTVLFDLDGTLLPMDQDTFVQSYFGGIAAHMAPYGYDPKTLIKAIWSGTSAMIQNDGHRTNECVFWDDFAAIFGEAARKDEPKFAEFYRTGFANVQNVCGYTPKAAETIRRLKARGLRTILATNPIFPAIATQSRIRWAGMTPEDFEWVTTYENSSYCKPNLRYYEEILQKRGLKAEECVMVGNDVTEDMVTETMGMKVFLLTDCLINKNDQDISVYPHGSFEELWAFLDSLE